MRNIFASSLPLVLMGALLALSGCGGNASGETPAAEQPAGQGQEPAAEQPADGQEPAAEQPAESRPAGVAEGFDQFAPPAEGEEYAVITTDFGVIELRLFPEAAPKAVENFVTHAKNGYYDGLIFHRVDQDFVIQTGDPEGTGMGGESIWGEGFMVEPSADVRHFNGALGMARSQELDSQGSQFYIVQNSAVPEAYVPELEGMRGRQDEEVEAGTGVKYSDFFPTWAIDKYLERGGAPMLDFGYTVFGQVFSGMDAVEQIAAVEVVEERPVEDVKLITVEIKEYGK